MKRRLAIPVLNKQLSPYFGACNNYVIFDAEHGIVSRYEMLYPKGLNILELPVWLADHGITDTIAYKIDAEIIERFAAYKINLFIGISIDSPDNLLVDWLNGKLESDEKIIKQLTLSIKR